MTLTGVKAGYGGHIVLAVEADKFWTQVSHVQKSRNSCNISHTISAEDYLTELSFAATLQMFGL